MFVATASSTAAPHGRDEHPEWLREARESLADPGDYLIYETSERGHAVQLKEGWTRVGRSLSADIRLDDPTVSRRHVLIFRDDDGAKVLDDRSLNGVFLNGEQVELSELVDGDTLSVGRFNLHFISLTGERVGSGGRAAHSRS